MSNYNTLKTTINANIKQNGNQEITGQIFNSVLNQMVTTLGAGYQFAGVATTATNPGTPDAKVFYIANGKGTYANFGNIEVTEDDVVVLYWDSSWHKEATGIASNEKLSELAFKGGKLTKQAEWVTGHYNDTTHQLVGSRDWRATKIDVGRSGGILKYNITGGGTSLNAIVDNNDNVLANISFGGGEKTISLDNYPTAKYVYLSNDLKFQQDYYARIEYPGIIFENELSKTTNDIQEIQGEINGTPQVVETLDWEGGYYNTDLENAGHAPTWYCIKYEITNYTDIMTVKCKSAAPSIAINVMTDSNNNILQNLADNRGIVDRTINFANYPTAKYIYLSTYQGEERSATVTHIATLGLEKRVVLLEKEKNTPYFHNKKVLVIGDSISTGRTSADLDPIFSNFGNYDKWVENLIDDNFFPADVINDSFHATGFVITNPNTPTLTYNNVEYSSSFLGRTQYIVAKYGIDLSKFDLIVVFGGINDYNALSDPTKCTMGTTDGDPTKEIIPAMEQFFAYLMTNAYQARICAIIPLRCQKGDNIGGVSRDTFNDAMKSVLKKYSLPYLDLCYESGFYPFSAAFRAMWTRDWDGTGRGDGLHPNAAYNRTYMSKQIEGFLLKLL